MAVRRGDARSNTTVPAYAHYPDGAVKMGRSLRINRKYPEKQVFTGLEATSKQDNDSARC
jgi:hypothetical protein